MKERPILMSAPMVRAILDGRKTQTRRVANTGLYAIDESVHGLATATREREKLLSRCPHGVQGDRLWVRETADFIDRGDGIGGIPTIVYLADGKERRIPLEHFYCFERPVRRPSIFMHRWASRLTLEVTGVRVERVQEISEEDAKAEGITAPMYPRKSEPSYRLAYRHLWDSLNAKRGFGWSKNPWVWVLEFKPI